MIFKALFTFLALILFHQGASAAPLTGYGNCSTQPNKKQICIDATPCKTLPSGLTVCLKGVTPPSNAINAKVSCWSYQTSYSCQDSASVDNCSTAPWLQKYGSACQQTSVSCDSTTPETGACAAWRLSYSCKTSPAVTEKVLQCTTTALGVDISMPTPATAANNPIKAAALMEAARQIGIYSQCDDSASANPDACLNKTLFNGVYETCQKGYFGLKNCCVSQPGAQSNSAVTTMAMGAGAQAVKFAGQKAIDTASPYVFDAMYSSQYTQGIMASFAGTSGIISNSAGDIVGTNFASGGLSLGAYGFTFGLGSAPASMLVEGSSTTVLMGAEAGSAGYIAFNPYVFAAVVAIQVVQSLAQCSSNEQLLGMHKGQNLSVKVGEKCVQKIPLVGTCIKWEEGWCSYNGALGKIMGTQARAQLGMSLDQSCQGLSVKQLQQVNWDSLDMSEFTTQISAQATKNVPNTSAVPAAYNQTLNAKPVNGVNTNTGSGLGYPSN